MIHCQRHNGPKALRTLTNSTSPLGQSTSFDKFWNLDQTLAYFFGKRRKLHRTLTNSCYIIEISIWWTFSAKAWIWCQIWKNVSIGLKKSGFEKKVSVSVSKNLVSKKSLSLEKLGLKKVSISVLKKSLSIGLDNIWSQKKSR